MTLKHIKLLNIASLINVFLGVFLVGCGLLEFLGLIRTDAATDIEAAGIRLSYLVFISGVLVLGAGMFSFLDRKQMKFINIHIFTAAASLAWPVFISLVLFFTQYTICIRLVPTALSSLFFIISVMIVKVTNDTLKKVHKFTPSQSVGALSGEKRKAGIDVSIMLKGKGKRKSGVNVSGALHSSGKRRSGISIARLFRSSGKRASSHRANYIGWLGKLLKPAHKHGKSGIYSGQRRRGVKLRSRYK